MIDTNALLSVAFSLIAGFTNVVQVPPATVPQNMEDVEMYAINPIIPTCVIIRGYGGTTYTIFAGRVQGYSTLRSYFGIDDIHRISEFTGDSKFTTNEVLELATKTLLRLSKHGDPVAGLTPRIQEGAEYQGKRIPFFLISWPYPPGYRGSSVAASAEIDGRNGRFVELHLFATNFSDYEFDEQLKSKVYKPDSSPSPKAQARKRVLPYPTTNQVVQIIPRWLAFCKSFGLDPGNATNFDQIDWEQSFIYTNDLISPILPACRITFTNKAEFESIEGTVCSYFSSDAFFVGAYLSRPQPDWDAMRGKVETNWVDLANDLQGRIAKLLGNTSYRMPKTATNVTSSAANIGTIGFTRSWVEWLKYPENAGPRPPEASELPRLVCAEFDLQKGQTKCISFEDPELIRAIGEAISNEPRAQ